MSSINTARRPFWLVWNPTGRNPQYRHLSEASATLEAERLAAAYPGNTFVVLHSMCSRRYATMERIGLSRSDADDDIPF